MRSVVESGDGPNLQDLRISRISNWLTKRGPVNIAIERDLSRLYRTLKGTVIADGTSFTPRVKKMLDEVLEKAPILGSEFALALHYALHDEIKLADIALNGQTGRYVKPILGLAHMVHVAEEATETGFRGKWHMEAALLLFTQEMISRENSPEAG